jgi:chemotaxis protein methyltransferase WspC
MDTSALGELLAAKLGIEAESMGPSFLNSLARRLLTQVNSNELQAFVGKAAAGGEHWQKLVESAVVSETWFFRDGEPFNYLVETVSRMWQKHRAIRILSCPCSTGEEPYSAAIALSEAGLPRESFAIDAADVSLGALKAAQVGEFKSRAFRGSHGVDRARYFQHDPGAQFWRLKPAWRSMVRFRHANLVSLQGLESAEPYDIVLCRNLLIYLHAEARAAVMSALRRLLTEDGILIVGHADPAIAREHGFTGIGAPGAFAFAKSTARKARKPAAPNWRSDFAKKGNLTCGAGPSAPATRRRHDISAAVKTVRSLRAEPSLDHIRLLGDQGKVKEAIQACRDYVQRIPDSADGYFLLGVLRGALQENDAAERALRRALYLDPDHSGARMHLSLLHDTKSNSAAAQHRARLNRVREP